MNIYDRIKMLRQNAGMSQGELAKRCGYSEKSMISRIESGAVDLPFSKVEVFATALNVDAAYLAGFCEDQRLRDRALMLSDLINKAASLDKEDSVRIAERIDVLLESDKYKGGNEK